MTALNNARNRIFYDCRETLVTEVEGRPFHRDSIWMNQESGILFIQSIAHQFEEDPRPMKLSMMNDSKMADGLAALMLTRGCIYIGEL